MFTDVMIDIETASTKYDACILSIGIVKFNLFDSSKEREELELLIFLDSSIEAGLRVSDDTMNWWKKQDIKVYNHVFIEEPRLSLKDALERMNKFLSQSTLERYWSQGSFDYVILENALEKLEMTPVWKFYQIRDSRTLSQLISILPKKPTNAHNAIVDCNYQIDVVLSVYDQLKLEPIKRKKAIVFDYSKDWICGICGAGNFSYRTKCFKCDAIKAQIIN